MSATLLAIILAVLGSGVGIVKIAEYLQTNAKAHSDVESLHREMENMAERLTALEVKVERLEKDNTSLIEQNRSLASENELLVKMFIGPEEATEVQQ